jgi:lysozyme
MRQEANMALLDLVIDVSDAQGVIDWAAVRASGIRVAMIKATQGTEFTARTWPANSAGARAAGIAVIPYHFLTDDDPAAQAQHFTASAGLVPGAAYAIDWEGTDTASPAQVDAAGQALVAVVGRTPLGYWGIPGSTPATPSAFMMTWERWIPRYRKGEIADFTKMPAQFTTPFNPPPGPFLFWQYTDGGVVGGVHGAVDRSVGSFSDADAMVAWCTAPAPGM